MMMIVSFYCILFLTLILLILGFDPVKMATNALNTITEKLPFKLPWK
jgi:hypothetical protein